MDSFEEIWELVREELKSTVTEVAYNVWLSPLKFEGFKNDTVYLSISEFKKKIIADKFSHIILKAFESILGFSVNIEYVVSGENTRSEKPKDSNVSIDTEYDYTFDNFITGPSNKFSHAAALNVAKNPGKAYNPLFIYGHSGLGKTHLLTAIMNEIKSKDPNADIIYTSGELFTNELV